MLLKKNNTIKFATVQWSTVIPYTMSKAVMEVMEEKNCDFSTALDIIGSAIVKYPHISSLSYDDKGNFNSSCASTVDYITYNSDKVVALTTVEDPVNDNDIFYHDDHEDFVIVIRKIPFNEDGITMMIDVDDNRVDFWIHPHYIYKYNFPRMSKSLDNNGNFLTLTSDNYNSYQENV